MVKDKVDIKSIQTGMGHSRASFTLDRYAHLLDGRDEDTAESLEASNRRAMQDTVKRA
jgi:hypothetical protein